MQVNTYFIWKKVDSKLDSGGLDETQSGLQLHNLKVQKSSWRVQVPFYRCFSLSTPSTHHSILTSVGATEGVSADCYQRVLSEATGTVDQPSGFGREIERCTVRTSVLLNH